MFFLGLWLYLWNFLERSFSETVALSAPLTYATDHQSPHRFPGHPPAAFRPTAVSGLKATIGTLLSPELQTIHISPVFPSMCFTVPESNPGHHIASECPASSSALLYATFSVSSFMILRVLRNSSQVFCRIFLNLCDLWLVGLWVWGKIYRGEEPFTVYHTGVRGVCTL